jgi:hypothetical protein
MKTPDKNGYEDFEEEEDFQEESNEYYKDYKEYQKAERKKRKMRVNVLPLYQRILYNIWFISILVLLFFPPVVFLVVRRYLVEYFFIPENAINYSTSSIQEIFFTSACFFCGIPFVLFYSYITNKGIIRKADKLYQMGSFQEYPKKFNLFLQE